MSKIAIDTVDLYGLCSHAYYRGASNCLEGEVNEKKFDEFWMDGEISEDGRGGLLAHLEALLKDDKLEIIKGELQHHPV